MDKTTMRPCLVKGKKCLFHRWVERRWTVGASPLRGGHPGGLCAVTMALVEDENGQIMEVYPLEVRFIDDLIQEYVFSEEKIPTTFEPCKCYHTKDEHGECWGTKEKDPCSCGGDKTLCDYYKSRE